MQTTTEQPLWIGMGGEIFCTTHAGYYLQSATHAAPTATEHHTPTNHWINTSALHLDPTQHPCEACQ